VYPALAVLQALQAETQGNPHDELAAGAGPLYLQVLWVGSVGGMEADLVKRAGIDYLEIPAGQLHGVGIRRLPGNLLAMARGYRASRAVLSRFQPQVLFFTGGFVACRWPWQVARSVEFYVPDIEPDWPQIAIPLCPSHRGQRRFAHFSKMPFTSQATRCPTWKLGTHGCPDRWPRRIAYLLVLAAAKATLHQQRSHHLPDRLAEMVVHISGLDWPAIQATGTSCREAVASHPALL
jgi:UDP-N-acetylglucosamine--N-acetylmuramyl-(pentapeptide) pyrophosphoryl-undecaprenol N-acetylglucosamine transferase